RVIGSGGGLGGQLNDPIGVFTDAAGDLYVADTGNNRIQEFADPPAAGGGTTGAGGTGGIGTGGAGGTGGPPASLPPHVTNVTQSHAIWRTSAKLGKPARSGKRPPVGTTFSFNLDQPARVRFAFAQRLPGRKQGTRCVAPRAANRRRPGCER